MIKIDGWTIPTPSEYQVGIQDLDKAERNAKGKMVKERIRSGVRKLEFSWKYLGDSELKTLLTAVSVPAFTVEFPDPEDGEMRTGTFYAGDRKVGALDYQNGKIRWKDVQFNVIEW